MDKNSLLSAHQNSANHRQQILESTICGCFHCLKTFEPSAITEWCDITSEDTQEGQTALCPFCGIDSVIGDNSGYPISHDFLKGMQLHWFR